MFRHYAVEAKPCAIIMKYHIEIIDIEIYDGIMGNMYIRDIKFRIPLE